ncbi:transcriptional regulator, MarR family protein [Paenibacillus vortex V453]|jgi:DNA-binding MarR family transcriptional regulator|uniref:MarR family transcriptional regulator n=2 Tax=Paenibacillus TaxID=44249 RepID=A0A163HCQ9_9BACL|nr:MULTISPECIES: MarR family transcriptional regulator [Paenibacillus]ANA79480.1 MarR family transcriptional regulator [Paenibacillus glucanolyticus]AVV56571.1 MarR family transcriptional regulator [Paenibacillus glucanolyticus]AWP25737.1 MarR family transcriptional regulator [Paenibacillus sp. Cedars]EFU38339.1 transcriptional regulator, MarR family protein [Paenibacillus vortex V453]ETT31146.1 MarR family transcriptional regulator [Paenibacillus sp. FSL R5-808]
MSMRNEILELEMLFKKMVRTVHHEWQKEGFPKIGRTQYAALEKLHELGSLRLSDLADTIHVTCGAVTGISDKLIEGGFARRIRDTEDRRVVHLEITPRGLDLIDQLAKKRAELSHLLYGFLSDEEVKQLNILYRKIMVNVEHMQSQMST